MRPCSPRTPPRRFLLGLLVLFCISPAAHALDPTKATSQYLDDTWGVGSGFPGGAVHCIAQTPDGYLWIGSDEGLIRFDGTTFRIVTPPASMPLSFRSILSLVSTPDGSLWIRLQDSTILRYQNGIFHEVPVHTRQRSAIISVMHPQKNDAPLLTIVTGGSLRFNGAQFEDIPDDRFEPDSLVISFARTGDGKFWKGTRDSGLSYLSGGRLVPIRNGLPDTKINTLLAVGDRDLWVGTDNGSGPLERPGPHLGSRTGGAFPRSGARHGVGPRRKYLDRDRSGSPAR